MSGLLRLLGAVTISETTLVFDDLDNFEEEYIIFALSSKILFIKRSKQKKLFSLYATDELYQ